MCGKEWAARAQMLRAAVVYCSKGDKGLKLTGVVGVSVFSWVVVRSKAGQTVVGDLQDEAVVDDTVGGLEFTVREDDAVVEEHHALQRGRGTQRQTLTANYHVRDIHWMYY